MKWSGLLLGVLIGIVGCASFQSVGWVDLPDGTRLKGIEFESISKGAAGTDTSLLLVYHCPSAEAMEQAANDPSYGQKVAQKLLGIKADVPQCVKAAEASGASAGFLKALFNGGAAGAAIGAGLANSGDTITNTDNSSLSNQQGQAQGQQQGQGQSQKAISKSKATSSSKAVNKSRTKIEVDD